MATYNLTGPQTQILTSWLFETGGYLDAAVNASGQSARQALIATPTLDVTQWIRTNTKGSGTFQGNWDECAMVWWIRANTGVNITGPRVPPEAAAWKAILNAWGASIDDAFARISETIRNQSTVPITAENGSTSTMPAGQNLTHQRNMITNVVAVL